MPSMALDSQDMPRQITNLGQVCRFGGLEAGYRSQEKKTPRLYIPGTAPSQVSIYSVTYMDHNFNPKLVS